MAEVSGYEVNALLRSVRAIIPGDSPEVGDRQLMLLTVALCVASRSCEVDIDTVLTQVALTYKCVEQIDLTPLDQTVSCPTA